MKTRNQTGARPARGLLAGAAMAVLAFAAVPASAAVVTPQPGLIAAVGTAGAGIGDAARPELILVGKKRRGHRGHRGHRRHHGHKHRHRGHRRYRGPSIYFSLPYYAPPLYYGYRSYRPYRGNRCTRWRRRCAANWGYGNSSFYGCLRYHGC